MDYRFQTLIYEVVRSLPFQSRRGELVTTQSKRTQQTEGDRSEMITPQSTCQTHVPAGIGHRRHRPAVPRRDGACADGQHHPGKAPVRMAFFYVPNGMIMDAWNPTYEGKFQELPRSLKSLEPFKDDIIQLGNLTHNTGRALLDGAGDHGRCSGSYLTGMQVKKSLVEIKSGVSFDQIVANQIGKSDALPFA